MVIFTSSLIPLKKLCASSQQIESEQDWKRNSQYPKQNPSYLSFFIFTHDFTPSFRVAVFAAIGTLRHFVETESLSAQEHSRVLPPELLATPVPEAGRRRL